jgi:hypothetical protein
VLDGQQRITSLYRAITGIDTVYLIVRDLSAVENPQQLELKDLLEEFAGEERADHISVRLADVYGSTTRWCGGGQHHDLHRLGKRSAYVRGGR